MKFYSYIQRVAEHLDKLGVDYTIQKGTPIAPEEIKRFDDLVGSSLPKELKEYLEEMGDGFVFYHPSGGWHIEGFSACIEEWGSNQDDLMDEELERYYGSNFDEEVLAEGRRRRKWLPIYGFGGGGYTINYDCGEELGAIRYHDIRNPANKSSACIAKSIEEWMDKWSRFCFTSPAGSDFFESYIDSVEGNFSWDEALFSQEYTIDNQG